MEEIKVYKLENEFLKVELLNLGATIKKLEVKDKNGNFRNVVLGFEDIEKYRENPAYFGAVIGRTAGRIKNAELKIGDKIYNLDSNNNGNTLHGGKNSISHRFWAVEKIENGFIFSIKSPHLDNGYPANIEIKVSYILNKNELEITKMLIDGVLSDGLAILAGDSKIGKSWMVLWLCLQISRGEAVWGLPTRKTDVVYLALEDREWRVQQRMQELTDSPPENLRFGFSCGQLGAELEGQIEETLREFPSTGLIFIDTLQMVRDNTSAKVNAYAQDYKDLSGLKKLADDHGICIFVVHHTRKERDSSNIFNDMTGSTGILGVADTGMILRKDDRFGDCATLCITGRDVEEKKLKMQMRGVRWEITEALSAKDLRKERIPDFVFQVADFLLAHGRFRGTVSQLLAAVGNTELKPNLASKHLTRHYSDVLLPLGITYEYRKTAAARLVLLELHDGADGYDGSSGSERLVSLWKQNDGTFRLPQASSQASSASWEEAEDDEELPL